MDPTEIARAVAEGGNVQLLSDRSNHVFRVWREHETAIVKVYRSPSRERRERRSLEALEGVKGLPTILGRKSDEDHPWIVLSDAGNWNLATLTGNVSATKKAGEILRAVHEADPGDISNLAGGMDSEWIASDYETTFQRLQRYRRRLLIPPALIDNALKGEPPMASEPRAAHTRPGPESFIVNEAGEVTLVDWGWATLAPPEWDLSYALWRAAMEMGEQAVEALQEGYGRRVSDEDINHWIAYHAGQTLLMEAETQDGRLDHLRYLVDSLEIALAD